jgi:hypothetical protein
MYREMWNGDEMEEVTIAPRSWLSRIDKGVPNHFILSGLATTSSSRVGLSGM